MRRSIVIALAVALVLALGLAMLSRLQRSILFPREHIPPPPPGFAPPPETVRVDVAHADGHSEGWLLPGRGVSAVSPGPVVFFAHGNGELIDYAAPGLAPYRARGVSVALLEYRGYGRSGGEPSEAALVADLVAFYDAVVARPEVDGARAFAHGRSLGGGVVCGLARHRPLAALVLESTFRSVRVMARRFFLPGALVADPFDNEAAVRAFEGPVLVLHGARDALIPVEHGRALAALARDAERVEFDAGHNDLPAGARYWRAIDDLMARAGLVGSVGR